MILVGCWLNGKKRGLINTLISTATYFVGWIFARIGAKPLGIVLSNILPSIGNHTENAANNHFTGMISTSSNQFFYNGIAFMIIWWGITFLSRWLLRRLNFLKRVPILGTVNGIAGGVLDVVIGYLIIFMVLMVFQLWPSSWWQSQLANSGLAQWIILKTPVLTREAITWLT